MLPTRRNGDNPIGNLIEEVAPDSFWDVETGHLVLTVGTAQAMNVMVHVVIINPN